MLCQYGIPLICENKGAHVTNETAYRYDAGPDVGSCEKIDDLNDKEKRKKKRRTSHDDGRLLCLVLISYIQHDQILNFFDKIHSLNFTKIWNEINLYFAGYSIMV